MLTLQSNLEITYDLKHSPTYTNVFMRSVASGKLNVGGNRREY